MPSDNEKLKTIFSELLKAYGPQKWWPAKTRFEVIVGSILTQNVSWKNAKLAVNNLRKAVLLSPNAIHATPSHKIATLIRSSRFYNQKTEKLKNISGYLIKQYNGSLNKMFAKDMDVLRKELLDIKGIGKETTDSILLYAGKQLSFVSDAYTKRFLARYGIGNGLSSYEDIRGFFMRNLPKDIYLYNEYHALIVHHCYAVCKSAPKCFECSIKKINTLHCSHYRT